MLVLRCTHKLLKRLGQKPLAIEVTPSEPTLGEWLVSTIEWLNNGNLFLMCMHAETQFSILLPMKENMTIDDMIEIFYESLCERFIGLEVPPKIAERVLQSYGDQVAIAKNSDRKLAAYMNSVVQDMEHILYSPSACDYVTEGKTIIRACMEDRLNTRPRKKLEWAHSVEAFWKKLKSLAPGSPARISLWVHTIPQKELNRVMVPIVHGLDSDPDLAEKLVRAATNVSTLFDADELRRLLAWLDSPHAPPEKLLDELSHDFRREVQRKLDRLLEDDS